MDNIQELKKLKELLDEGILTQEEFDAKKKELLEEISAPSPVQEAEKVEETKETPKKKASKGLLKKLGIIVCIAVVLVVAVMGGKSIVRHNQQTKRAAALETGIGAIMTKYGIKNYAVKYAGADYDVYAEGFESLRNGEALECLKALDAIEVDDPCGDGKLSFFMTNVHPGLDVEYSYWRVSSVTVFMNKQYGGLYKTPGIYCNRSGSNKCVYECES